MTEWSAASGWVHVRKDDFHCGTAIMRSHARKSDHHTTGVTGGAPAQPKQASTRLSASTTTPSQAPEVSEAMMRKGHDVYSELTFLKCNLSTIAAIYTAMELKRRQELDEDQAYNG